MPISASTNYAKMITNIVGSSYFCILYLSSVIRVDEIEIRLERTLRAQK